MTCMAVYNVLTVAASITVTSGLDSAQADQLSQEIQSSATSTDVMSMFSMPLPSGIPVSDVMQQSIATGLHINAVLGALLSVVCVVLIRWSAPAGGARRPEASAP